MNAHRVAVVGDYAPTNHTHASTDMALRHARVAFEWVRTEELAAGAGARLTGYAGIFIAPSSPYRSMAGALHAIRYARERGVPLFGT